MLIILQNKIFCFMLASAIMLISFLPTQVNAEFANNVWVMPEYSSWKSGKTESWGYDFVLGYGHAVGKDFYAIPALQVLGGIQNINGDCFQAPVIGYDLSFEVGYKYHVRNAVFAPFISLHYAWDDMSLNDEWYRVYSKAGIYIQHNNIFMRAGLIMPVYTQVDATVFSSDSSSRFAVTEFTKDNKHFDVVLKPANRISYFSEAGIKIDEHFSASFVYEIYLFGTSPVVYAPDNSFSIYQEATENRRMGLKIQYNF